MRPVSQPQAGYPVVDDGDEMASRNPSGVDQELRKGNIRIVAANYPMAEVAAYDRLENQEDIRGILGNACDQNSRSKNRLLAMTTVCTHRIGGLKFYAYRLAH